MSLALHRYLAPLIFVGVALSGSPSAAADPDIDTQSAAAVIAGLQQEGYAVEVNGVSSANTALLSSCQVTQIHHSQDSPPDPTTTVYVDVACPISHG